MAVSPNSIVTPQTPNTPVYGVLLTTALTSTKAYDGTEATGSSMALIYTVGANGGQLPKLRIKVASVTATLPSGTTTATVVRVWLNNASPNTTVGNNILFDEVLVPATLYSQVAAYPVYTLDFGKLTLPAGTRIYAGMASTLTVTNAALSISMPGGGDL